jgi:type IV pilus assembly protein PilQ
MFWERNVNSRIKNRKDLFVWCLVLVVMAAIAVGGVGQVTVVARADEGVEAAGAAAGSEGPAEEIQSLSLKSDMTVRDALRFLATKYHKNIVPSAKVEGQVTVGTLYDVTFEGALNAILGKRFKYTEKDGVIWVYSAEEFKSIMEDLERMESRVFTLYYISAAEAQKLIEPVLSGKGTIKASSPAETVVPTGESISTGSAGGDTMALNDTIVVRDYPENIAEAERLLSEMDIRPKQVLVEATVLSATLNEGMELGVDWNTIDGVAVTKLNPDGIMTDGLAGAVTGVTGLTVGVTQDHVQVFIRALETVTETTVLANPKILAINKQLGQVYIGTKVGYRSQTTQTEGGLTTEKVEFLETGTKLSFRPYIGDDGYIRMDIHSKDSSSELNDEGLPDESGAELFSNIMVKDGQTVVIGGMFRDVVVTNRNQVPLLGDIPFLGVLFRSTVDSNKRQEVIVMLTPHIIKEPEETNSAARIDDVRRKRFGARDELQWFGRARLAEDRYAQAARYYIEGDNEKAMNELNVALELRPTYLEAIRLKEKIIQETDPDASTNIDRIMLGDFEQKDSEMFMRR